MSEQERCGEHHPHAVGPRDKGCVGVPGHDGPCLAVAMVEWHTPPGGYLLAPDIDDPLAEDDCDGTETCTAFLHDLDCRWKGRP